MRIVYKLERDLIDAYSRNVPIRDGTQIGDIIDDKWIVRDVNIIDDNIYITRLTIGELFIFSEDVFNENKNVFRNIKYTDIKYADYAHSPMEQERCILCEYIGN